MILWLVLILVVPAVLIGQIYLLGRMMSTPEKMLKPLTHGLTALHQETLVRYKDWLASVGLEYRSCFQFGVASVIVFQQGNEPRYFSFLLHRKLSFTIETYLADLTIYETGTSGSVNLFPRPGSYAESFPDTSPSEAWLRHLEGEAYLTRKFGFRWVPLNRSYEEILLDAIRLRMKYNRSQAFWPVRVLYRYAVNRHTFPDRSVAEQYP